MPKFWRCAIFRPRVIRQKVSLKIIVFSMETPCWSPSEGLQHGGRKPVKTSGVYFASLKTFILSVKLEDIRMGLLSTFWLLRTRKHKANRYFRASNMLSRNNADVTHCENTVFYFQNKAVYRAEDGQKNIFKYDFYLIKVKT